MLALAAVGRQGGVDQTYLIPTAGDVQILSTRSCCILTPPIQWTVGSGKASPDNPIACKEAPS